MEISMGKTFGRYLWLR